LKKECTEEEGKRVGERAPPEKENHARGHPAAKNATLKPRSSCNGERKGMRVKKGGGV